MQYQTFLNRHLNTVFMLIVLLGTATLAALALAALLFAAVLLHTLIDAIIEVIQAVTDLYTHGDAITRLLLLVFLLFAGYKAAPRVFHFLRRQVDLSPYLRARTVNANARGPRQDGNPPQDDEDETAQATPADRHSQRKESPQQAEAGTQPIITPKPSAAQCKQTPPGANRVDRQGNGQPSGQPSRAYSHQAAKSQQPGRGKSTRKGHGQGDQKRLRKHHVTRS
jgi:hypothetical protein